MAVATPNTSPLKNLRVAAPCNANWEEMDGDARVRHCALCKMNVYNLSDMSQAEAEALIKNKTGRLCVQFYQREDGTVVTDNCPVGLRAIRKRLAWISAGIAAGFFFAAGGALSAWGKLSGQNVERPTGTPSTNGAPIQALTNWAKPPAPAPANLRMVKGEMCVPAPGAPIPAAPVPAKATATNE